MKSSSSKLLIDTLQGKASEKIPYWFMRQAGRYLPEYKQLRSKADDFLTFCHTPSMAMEATLQPIQRFGMSAAILFSDILVIPQAMGVQVRFEEGVGPRLSPVQTLESLEWLRFDPARLEAVYEAIVLTKQALPEQTALIGFAGSPWTLACYMVEGRGDRDFQKVRIFSIERREFFLQLMSMLTEAVAEHCIRQIEAGAEAIQLFDSWSGVLSERQFDRWVIQPTREIVDRIRARHPDIPIIGFPRLAGVKYLDYAKGTGVNAVNIDGSVTLEWAASVLQPICVVQGNLDPVVLGSNMKAALAEAKRIISILGDKPFVFNLGHGILPHTPLANVKTLCDFLENYAVKS